jgi:hypothetical protein
MPTHRWFHDLAYVFGGVFLANVIPHFVAGVSGVPMQSPFASPPGIGLSSSPVNVAWGLINLFVAYLLLVRVGRFELRRWRHAAAFAGGFGAMGWFLAKHFGALHGGLI